jgi:hypothetical protein
LRFGLGNRRARRRQCDAQFFQHLAGVLAQQRRRPGVPIIFTAKPMFGTLPSTGWSISMRMARWRPCSLSKASG